MKFAEGRKKNKLGSWQKLPSRRQSGTISGCCCDSVTRCYNNKSTQPLIFPTWIAKSTTRNKCVQTNLWPAQLFAHQLSFVTEMCFFQLDPNQTDLQLGSIQKGYEQNRYKVDAIFKLQGNRITYIYNPGPKNCHGAQQAASDASSRVKNSFNLSYRLCMLSAQDWLQFAPGLIPAVTWWTSVLLSAPTLCLLGQLRWLKQWTPSHSGRRPGAVCLLCTAANRYHLPRRLVITIGVSERQTPDIHTNFRPSSIN